MAKTTTCGHCGAANAFPRFSVGRKPVCGACLHSFPEPFGARLRRVLFSFRSGCPSVVGTIREGGGGLRPVAGLASDLGRHLERLAEAAWPHRGQAVAPDLMLRPAAVAGGTSEEDAAALLRHVAAVAPRLPVPRKRPRIRVSPFPVPDVGGAFVERDGWVEITIEKRFFDDRAAGRAVLCHELCHYVLGAAGIREAATRDNERLTDVAMFAFGLGEVYMAGYAARPSGTGRAGHRLGYLTNDDYRSVLAAARAWWRQGRFRPDASADLERRLRNRLGGASKFEEYYGAVSKKHPRLARPQILEEMDQSSRDRG